MRRRDFSCPSVENTTETPCIKLHGLQVGTEHFFENNAGADPGEVKRVNFHPLFPEPTSFFFFLSLNYRLVLIHYYKNSPPISKSWIRAWEGNRL